MTINSPELPKEAMPSTLRLPDSADGQANGRFSSREGYSRAWQNPAWQSLATLSEILGGSLLVFLGALLILATILFFTGLPMPGWVVFAAAGITLLYGFLWIKKVFSENTKKLWIALGVYLGLLAGLFWLSLSISGRFFDLSFDGQWYHASAVLQISRGWNPVQNPQLEQVVGSIPIGYYPKASWINAAALYLLTGHIEQAKSVNILLMAASWFLSLAAFLKYASLSPIFAVGLSLSVCLNPVILYQSVSLYNDGQLGALFSCMVMLILLLDHRANNSQREDIRVDKPLENFPHAIRFLLIAFSCAFILITNMKFTGAIYGVLLFSGLWLWFVLIKSPKVKEVAVSLVISFLLGLLVIGYNPYLTNTLHQNWESALRTTVTQVNTPLNLTEMNFFNKLFYSLFAESTNSTLPAHLQAPFLVSRDELKVYSFADVRIGGFGPFFGEILFLSLVLGAVLLVTLSKGRANSSPSKNMRKFDQRGRLLFYLLGLVILTIIVNPEAWWARYAPQTWLIPILVILSGLVLASGNIFIKVLSLLLFGFVFLNSILVGIQYFQAQAAGSRELDRTLTELSSRTEPSRVDFGHGIINQPRFDEYGIIYTPFKAPACPEPLLISGMDTLICPGG